MSQNYMQQSCILLVYKYIAMCIDAHIIMNSCVKAFITEKKISEQLNTFHKRRLTMNSLII